MLTWRHRFAEQLMREGLLHYLSTTRMPWSVSHAVLAAECKELARRSQAMLNRKLPPPHMTGCSKRRACAKKLNVFVAEEETQCKACAPTRQGSRHATAPPVGLRGSLGQGLGSGALARAVAGQGLVDGEGDGRGLCLGNTCTQQYHSQCEWNISTAPQQPHRCAPRLSTNMLPSSAGNIGAGNSGIGFAKQQQAAGVLMTHLQMLLRRWPGRPSGPGQWRRQWRWPVRCWCRRWSSGRCRGM